MRAAGEVGAGVGPAGGGRRPRYFFRCTCRRVIPEGVMRCSSRNGREPDRLEATRLDFSRLLQGLLVDAEGRPVSLAATGFHSAFGQIRDMLAGSGELRRIAELVLRELAER
jgi:hypothetical protein